MNERGALEIDGSDSNDRQTDRQTGDQVPASQARLLYQRSIKRSGTCTDADNWYPCRVVVVDKWADLDNAGMAGRKNINGLRSAGWGEEDWLAKGRPRLYR